MALEDTVKKIIQVDVSSAVTSMDNLKKSTNEAGQSFNSLKDYKNYIEKLKASLLDVNEESDEYKKRVNEIKSAQEKLNKTLKASDTQVKDAEGSYNALSKQMAELKKQFKATSDEAERMKIAKQISGINDQLKDMDASIGVYSRNVGNYQSAFTAALRDLGDGFDAIIPGAKKAFDFVDKLFKGLSGGKGIGEQLKEIFNFKINGNFGKQANEIDVNTKSLEKLTKTTRNWQAVESATQAYQAATAGATVKTTKEVIKQTGAYSALAMAKKRLAEAERDLAVFQSSDKESIQKLAKATEERVKRLKEQVELEEKNGHIFENQAKNIEKTESALSKLAAAWKAMGTAAKVGVGLAVAAVTALVAVAVHFIKKAAEARKAALELQTTLEAGASGAAEQRVAIEQLAKKYGELGDSVEKKKKFLVDYKDEIEKTGVAVNDVNIADDLFIKNTSKYITALENRAKAQAAQNLAIKKYEEYYEKLAELQAKQASAPEERQTQQIGTSTYGAVYAIDTRKTKSDIQKDIDELSRKAKEEIGIIYKFAEESQNAVGNILGEKPVEIKIDIDFDENEIKDDFSKIEDDLKKILANDRSGDALKVWGRTQLFDLSDLDKQLVHLKYVYSQEKKLLAEYGLDTSKLTKEYEQAKSDIVIKGVDERMKKLDEEAALKIFLNEKTKQNEYRRVAETLSINDELLNAKKAELEAAINDDNLMIEEKERLKNELKRINAEIQANNQAMVDNNKKKAKEWIGAYQNLSSSLGSIFGAIADIYMENAEYNENMTKEEEEQARNNFETAKAYQQGQVWITGLAGMVGALAAPFLSPADTILPFSAKVALGAVESAAILATTIAQSVQIANTQFGSGASGGGGTGETTATVEAQSYSPQYTQNVTGQSDYVELSNAISEGQSDTKVYILESDIQTSGKRVTVRQEETTF